MRLGGNLFNSNLFNFNLFNEVINAKRKVKKADGFQILHFVFVGFKRQS